ncbi:MAG TPA: hypothetical protein VK997_04975 [Deferrisomatales bacterium]|nr:hypothetical protein [Deferrisomatales bacterium]
MRGVGLILVLLGLAFGGYFVAQNLEAVKGERGGRTVVEPMAAAKDVAGRATQTLDNLQKSLDEATK